MIDLEKLLSKELRPNKWVRRISWIGLVALVALSLAFSTTLYRSAKTTVRTQAVRNLTNIVQLNEDSLTRELQHREDLLRMTATRLEQHKIYDVATILEEMQEVADNYGCFQTGVIDDSLTLYRSNGDVVDVSALPMTAELWDGESHITGSYYSAGNDDYMVNLFSCPLFEGDQLRCVLVSTYYSKDLTSRMNLNSLQGKGYTFLLDAQGQLVITPQHYEDADYTALMHFLKASPAVSPAEDADLFFIYNGEKYYGRCEKLAVNDWYLMTCAREADVFAEASLITRSAFATLGVIWAFILLSLLTSFYVSRRFQQALRQSHFHDKLLGIGNINALETCFARLPAQELSKYFLCVMDIDKFKEFNYLYGSDKGDALLCYIVQVFREETPDVQVFRQYNDFFVLLDPSEDIAVLEQKVKQTQDRFATDIQNGVIEPFSTSAGIRKVDPSLTLHQLFSDALFTRDLIKGDHSRCHAFYDDSLRDRRLRYMEMESAFDAALKAHEFHVYYQPKYDIDTGTIIGAEALSRWIRADGTMISPGEFVPCFEASRQIIELDEYVLTEVCDHLREMTVRGLPVRPVSVNLSRVHLLQPGIFPRLSSIIESAGIDPKNLSFEITESALTEANIPLRAITDQLRSLGCRVDMDDYGVGASGPRALASNCFDVVKLDKSFIDAIGNGQVEAVIETTIQLARRLGLDVIAEGVEEDRQAQRLTDLGCYSAQGYFYSKPLAVEDYVALLRAEAEHAAPPIEECLSARHAPKIRFSEDFRVALDNITQPIYIIDPESYEILYCNEIMRYYMGTDPTGQLCHKAIRGLDEPCPNCVAAKLYHEGVNETVEYLTPVGKYMLVRASALNWRGNTVYEVVCLDISAQKQLEADLRLHDKEYSAVVYQSTSGVMRYDIASGAASINVDEDLQRVEEYVIENCYRNLRDSGLIDPDSYDAMDALFSDIRSGAPSRGYDVHVRPRHGDPQWYHMDYTLIDDETGQPTRAVVSFYDNTEQQEKKLAYRRWNARFSAMMSEYTAYMEIDLSADIIEAEGRYGEWAHSSDGRCFSEALECMAATGVFEDDRASFRTFFHRERLLGRFLAGHTDGALEYRTMMEGKLLWYRAELQMVSDPTTGNVKASILISNVDEQLRQQRDLKDAAERDAMTGLYNHTIAETLIRQVLELQTGERCCLLIVDLDDLRLINSDFGHPEGDRALNAIADCMRAQFRRTDIMGRMGGDEFIVLLRDMPEGAALSDCLSAFLHRLNAHTIGPDAQPIRASVGAAIGIAGTDDFETLYHQADLALFYTKAMGKNDFHLYVPELEKREFHYRPQSSASLLTLEAFDSAEIHKLLQAISSYCPMIISVNLTQNTYRMMEYASYVMKAHPDEGCFDDLIAAGARSFHPDDRASFLRCFKRENLLAAWDRGERLVRHSGRQKGDDGVYRFTQTGVCMMQDEATGDICEITFSAVLGER
ncbi:MAG: EAL domain-containing protein [Eubacteriales bacterium]|nr:EAL domain-containing protein [Eubacteriales bacterium]